MKQKIYILGLITVLIIFTGLALKINHLAGANIALTSGIIILLFLFLPWALVNNYRGGDNRKFLALYIVTWITCIIIFGSGLFKTMHWQYGGIFLSLAIPFPYVVFLPVFLYVTSKSKNFNIYNTVFVLFLLVTSSVLSALLALNVSKDRISDSYTISENYIRMSAAYDKLQDKNTNSPVVIRIDELLRTINDYREIILKHEGLSTEQWENVQESLLRPEAKQISLQAIKSTGELFPGSKLENGLRSLVKEMESRPDFKELAKEASEVFDLEMPDRVEPVYAIRNITENSISWALIYLDGLETNLKMIKALVPDNKP